MQSKKYFSPIFQKSQIGNVGNSNNPKALRKNKRSPKSCFLSNEISVEKSAPIVKQLVLISALVVPERCWSRFDVEIGAAVPAYWSPDVPGN